MEGRGLPPGCPDCAGPEQAARAQGDLPFGHSAHSLLAVNVRAFHSKTDWSAASEKRPKAALYLRTDKSSLAALPCCLSSFQAGYACRWCTAT